MKFVYVNSGDIFAKIITTFERGEWSHVAIVDEDENYVIESLFETGVRRRRLDSLLRDRPHHMIIEVPTDPYFVTNGFTWLHDQVGKAYDWTGVGGIGFHRNWQDDDKWYCSELATTYGIRSRTVPSTPIEKARMVGVRKSLDIFRSVRGTKILEYRGS